MIEVTIISLPTAKERRKGIEEHFTRCPFPWRFQDAAPGQGYVPYDPERARQVYGRELNVAERGAFESHVRAVRRFLDASSNEFLMVCEDDIWIDFSFPFDDLLNAMKEAGIDFIRLFGRRIAPARHIQRWRNRWLVRFVWEPFGMQCYILSRRGADLMLAHASQLVRPIDDQLDRFWENGLPAYAVFPFPVMELQSNSSIVRMPVQQEGWRKLLTKLKRSRDRVTAIATGMRLTAKDRAFRAALLRSGV